MPDNNKKANTGKKNTAARKPVRSVSDKKETLERLNKKSTHTVARYVVLCFAVFLVLTFFGFIDSGWFGSFLKDFLLGLFGAGYFIIPFILFWLFINWKRDIEQKVAVTKYVLALVVFLFTMVFIHCFSAGAEECKTLGFTLYDTGKQLKSGGFIGGNLGALMCSAIGWIGALIISILITFVSAVFLFGSTPRAVMYAIKGFFGKLKLRVAEEPPVPQEKFKVKKEKKLPAPQENIDELPDDPNGQRKFDLPELPDDLDQAGFVPVNDDAELPWDNDSITQNGQEPTPDEEDDEDEGDAFTAVTQEAPYVFPPVSLLAPDDGNPNKPSSADVERTSRKLEEILASFNVKAKVVSTSYGPTVTRYELMPETGVRVKAISNLSEDIALHLAATSIRIENVPGKTAIGIEVPNRVSATVRLRELIENPVFRESKSRLFTCLGTDSAGNPIYLDIAKMPHLLIAGATGMGKSVCMNAMLISLLYRAHPSDVKLILVDPKRVELTDYNGIPHLLMPVINEPKMAAGTLNWACIEMERRYQLIQEVGARDLAGYNSSVIDDPERETLPNIVIVIDELADLMMTAPDDVETSICRLAQKARGAGMHLVIGTQRPSVDVITGLIKANIPSRIAFTVASQVDSRTILDGPGAEKLLGRGDMLYYPVGAMKPMRVQGAFVDGKTEVTAITQFIKEAYEAKYDDEIIKMIEQEAKMCGVKHGKRGATPSEEQGDDDSWGSDPMLLAALELAFEKETISTSLLQRTLQVGFARAARIIDKLEAKGYIGEYDAAAKKRRVLITKEELLELKMNSADK